MISNWIESHLAEIIAFLALAATSWQGWLARRHNALSVRPVLDSWLDTSEDTLHFWIQNKGLGSAEIVSFDMELNGKKLIHDNLRKVLSNFPYKIDYSPHISELNSHGTSYLTKDEKVDLVKIKFENLTDAFEINEYLESIFSLNITYKSLYGKSFEYKISPPSS